MKIIAISNEMREKLISNYGMLPEKITVIHNGVQACTDVDETRKDNLRKEFTIKKHELVLMSIARLSQQKGHSYLLKALERIVKDNPSVILILVGDGPLEDEIRREISQRQLSQNVRLAGFRTDIGEVLSISDIFVLPSLDEGFSYIILESMAAGIPVIATAVGGNKEAVVNGITGILSPPADVSCLYTAIQELIIDEGKRKELGKNGRIRVAHLFSRENMMKETLLAYKLLQ